MGGSSRSDEPPRRSHQQYVDQSVQSLIRAAVHPSSPSSEQPSRPQHLTANGHGKTMSQSTPPPQDRGVVAVIVQDARFLVIRRSQHVRAPGAYCFPGGAIEGSETEPVALRRELREELEASIQTIRRIWQCSTPNGVELGWWQAVLQNTQSLRPNPHEVDSFHWLTASQIVALPQLLDTNRRFMSALHRSEITLDS